MRLTATDMKQCICLFIVTVMTMGSGGDEVSDAELLVTGNRKFTAKMFSEVAKNNVKRALAIGLSDDESTKSVFAYMNKKIRSVKGIDLRMANSIYIADGYNLNDDYLAISREIFQSDIKSVDFTKSEKTTKEINAWVEDQTNHHIKNLVSSEVLSEDTTAILVNAIYFKGMWKDTFNKNVTRDSDFHATREKTVKVPMMYRKGNFNYGESAELGAKILEIPYEGDESAFYIILPDEIDGITELENKLQNPSVLENSLKSLFEIQVAAHIPKFKIETTTNLKDILQNIGVEKIFSAGEANLNKLLKENRDLYISDAVQKAFIEINEEGAEAAVANDFVISLAAPFTPQDISFVADHPFVFVLKTGENILFSGVFSS
ncbi:unnamed protein product, partial [Iphiclides podalirius]